MADELTGYTEIQKRLTQICLNEHINNYEDFIIFSEDIIRELFIHYLVLNDVDPEDSKAQHMYAKAFTDMHLDDLNDFILYMKEKNNVDSFVNNISSIIND